MIVRKMTQEELGNMIRWYEQRTRRTATCGTIYERTIKALKRLSELEVGINPNLTLASHEELTCPEEPIQLTERQAQFLHLIHTQRYLIDPTTAPNQKVIGALIEIGALSAWREITPAGKHALASFIARKKEA